MSGDHVYGEDSLVIGKQILHTFNMVVTQNVSLTNIYSTETYPN